MNTKMNERRIDRLDKFEKHQQINDNQITRRSGFAVGTLGKSRKDGKDISGRVCRMIVDAFPMLNIDWLLRGEGEMLIEPGQRRESSIPLIDDATAECGALTGTLDSTAYARFPKVEIPGIPAETEFFIRASGYSMVNDERPEFSIPHGSLVGLQKMQGGNVRWGEAYALATPSGIMLKRVFPAENRDQIRCVSYNSADYPEFTIDRSEILQVARITCVVPVYVR